MSYPAFIRVPAFIGDLAYLKIGLITVILPVYAYVKLYVSFRAESSCVL